MTIKIDMTQAVVLSNDGTYGGGIAIAEIPAQAAEAIMLVLQGHRHEVDRELRKFGITFDQLLIPHWMRVISPTEVLEAVREHLAREAAEKGVQFSITGKLSDEALDLVFGGHRARPEPDEPIHGRPEDEPGPDDKPFETTVRGTVYPFAILKSGAYVLDGWSALATPQQTAEFEERVRELQAAGPDERLDYVVTQTLAYVRHGRPVPHALGDRRVTVVRLLNPETGKPVHP